MTHPKMRMGRRSFLLGMSLLMTIQGMAGASSDGQKRQGHSGFRAHSEGSPIATMSGHWQEGDQAATLRFLGSSPNNQTTFGAYWKSNFANHSSLEGKLISTTRDSGGDISLTSRYRYQLQGGSWGRWINQPVVLSTDEAEDQMDFSYTPWAPGPKHLRFHWELRGKLEQMSISSTVELWVEDT